MGSSLAPETATALGVGTRDHPAAGILIFFGLVPLWVWRVETRGGRRRRAVRTTAQPVRHKGSAVLFDDENPGWDPHVRRARPASTALLVVILTGGCVQGWPWASPPVPTGDCAGAFTSADVSGDGVADDIVHALEETGPVLRVCLHDGTISEIVGMGQGEVLEIIDIGEDGTREIVYGATTASSMSVRLAVWRGDRLVRVVAEGAAPLELQMGGDGTFDEEDGWSAYRFWGCADMDGDGRIDLVSAKGPRSSSDSYTFDLTSYAIEGATARLIASEAIESPAPDSTAADYPYRCQPPP